MQSIHVYPFHEYLERSSSVTRRLANVTGIGLNGLWNYGISHHSVQQRGLIKLYISDVNKQIECVIIFYLISD